MFEIINNPKLKEIWKYLPDARLVGGCVRDILLGVEPKDTDLATPTHPEGVMNIFSSNGFNVIPVGITHGTVTIMIDGEGFEITTLRKETDNDGRHATVEWIADWKADAQRRDFTFNSMYIDRNGFLYDYFDGQDDLKNKIVRFVGNADERIKEDALRILRYFRFVGRFSAFNYDDEAIKAIENNKGLIKNLSVERIFSELVKIFNNEKQWIINEKMNDLGISEVIFGKDIPIPKNVFFEPDYLTTFAVISNGEIDFMRKFKASIEEIKFLNNVNHAPEITMFAGNLRITEYLLDYSINEVITKAIINSFNENINITTWNNFVKMVKNIVIPVFPVRGKDFLDKGYKGIEIGNAMKTAKKLWVHSNFKMNKEEILKLF